MLRFVTSNKHKFEEFQTVAARFGLEIELAKMTYIEVQSDNLEEIAVESARYCADRLGKSFFIEDAGLFVDSLGGFPGPYSSYVYSTLGNGGILDLLGDKSDRSAYFLSVICYYDGEFHIYKGKVKGKISLEARGMTGFGFDPIFVPVGHKSTFAEMGLMKNAISHRARSAEIFFRSLVKG